MVATKRIRRSPEEAKALILRTAEQIMIEDGYAAVTVRHVAKTAGVSSTLLHYYYETGDDLLLALYRHSCERDLVLLEAALGGAEPLMALWTYQTDATRVTLAAEYLALANHKKVIRAEISRFAEHARRLQMEMIARYLRDSGGDYADCSPECISMLLTSISRNLIIESGVGISLGHDDARAYVEKELARLLKTGNGKRSPAARA